MKTHHRVPGKFVVRSTTTKTTKLQTSLRRVALLGLLLLLLLPAALAFGIKPAQKSITFEPNLTVDAQFDLVRDTEAPGIAIISIEGDLAPYLTLPQTTIPVSGSAQSIKYSIKLPESLPAGTHVGKLIVTEQSSATGVINSRVRITFKVLVTVPGENLPITAEVVNHQNILYIEPSVTLNTPLNVQLNEREFASLGLLTLIGILALYTSLVLRIR